jgi:hypothetical protein
MTRWPVLTNRIWRARQSRPIFVLVQFTLQVGGAGVGCAGSSVPFPLVCDVCPNAPLPNAKTHKTRAPTKPLEPAQLHTRIGYHPSEGRARMWVTSQAVNPASPRREAGAISPRSLKIKPTPGMRMTSSLRPRASLAPSSARATLSILPSLRSLSSPLSSQMTFLAPSAISTAPPPPLQSVSP